MMRQHPLLISYLLTCKLVYFGAHKYDRKTDIRGGERADSTQLGRLGAQLPSRDNRPLRVGASLPTRAQHGAARPSAGNNEPHGKDDQLEWRQRSRKVLIARPVDLQGSDETYASYGGLVCGLWGPDRAQETGAGRGGEEVGAHR